MLPRPLSVCLGGAALLLLAHPLAARAAGHPMVPTASGSVASKPQSKVFHHDGSYWAILQGRDGVAFHELVCGEWRRCTFADAVLAPQGNADVLWTGTRLVVLLFGKRPQLFEYEFDAARRTWDRLPGFPAPAPDPNGAETMVVDQDSRGRLWLAAEGARDIRVYHTTTGDHRSWSEAILLREDVDGDDVAAVIAFGGDRMGVLWSDQERREFAFRARRDADPPGIWGPIERLPVAADQVDDHLNLAADARGRVFAVTKDVHNRLTVHRRDGENDWESRAIDGFSKRAIVLVADEDTSVYVLYSRYDTNPRRIEHRVAHPDSLEFRDATPFITSYSDLRDVSATKQRLPRGSLVAIAGDDHAAYWNAFDTSPAGPGTPHALSASLRDGGNRVLVNWSDPEAGPATGYEVYREIGDGPLVRLTTTPRTQTHFDDVLPGPAVVRYRITPLDEAGGRGPSAMLCVDTRPTTAPGSPRNLVATTPSPPRPAVELGFDEGAGQVASDRSGHELHARLGATPEPDAADPTWTLGVAGAALAYDGLDDHVWIPAGPALNLEGSFSFSAWVRRDSSGSGTILDRGAPGKRSFRVRSSDSGAIRVTWLTTEGEEHEFTIRDLLTAGQWRQIAGTFDERSGEFRLLVDGELRGLRAANVPIADDQYVVVGARRTASGRSDFFRGVIDEVVIVPSDVYLPAFRPAAPSGAGDGRAAAPTPVVLAWEPPADESHVVGYNIYRHTSDGVLRLNAGPVRGTRFVDAPPDPARACYHVTAIEDVRALEGPPSATACVTR